MELVQIKNSPSQKFGKQGLRELKTHTNDAVSRSKMAMEGTINERIRAFKIAANEVGYVESSESEDGTVLWLHKNSLPASRETHQRMCIDSLTNSVTVFWMTFTGKLTSKTFRGVPALQEWFKLGPELITER